MHSDRLILG